MDQKFLPSILPKSEFSFLKKQKQELQGLEVEVTAEREKDKVPALFSDIHIHFKLSGELAEDRVKRAVDLSMEKYCSVVKILEKTAKVTSSFEIVAQR